MTGPELKNIRNQLGLSQPAFALALGLTGKHRDRTIRKWEHGKCAINFRTECAAKMLLTTKGEE